MMDAIAKAFIRAKKQFGPALKRAENPFHKSKYADLSQCLEAVDEALLNNGIVLFQQTSLDESGVTVETVLLHETGQIIRSGPLHVPAQKKDPQGFGSALTYARRYSLMATCGIAPEDDDGENAMNSFRGPVDAQDVLGDTPEPKNVTTSPKNAKNRASNSEYEVTFGRFNGQTLSSIDPKELSQYVEYLLGTATKAKKPIDGRAKEFVERAQEYLKSL